MPDRIAFVDQQGDTLATATNDILGGQLARLVAEMDALDAAAVVVEALPVCELSRREGIGYAVEMLRDALDVTLPTETVESVRNQLFATQETVKILRAQVRTLQSERDWLLARAGDELVTAFVNAKRAKAAAAPGGAEGSAVEPSDTREGPDVAAQPEETVDIAAWCRDRMEAFLSWESHEMAMFPSGAEREVAIVEWVVRVLGNPELANSAEVVRLLAARHEAVSDAAR
jgi:hypothetical protein